MNGAAAGSLPRLAGRALWLASGGRQQRRGGLMRAWAAASAAGYQQAPRSARPQRQRPQRPGQQRGGGGGGGAGSGGSYRGGGAARRQPPPSPLLHRQQAPPRADYFYAESAASFEQLGLSPAVAAALQAAGYPRPSRVQELAVPPLLAGKDVVLAAETGSGKTLAYLAPIASLLLRHREAEAEGGATAAAPGPGAGGGPDAAPAAAEARRPLALVLVPNTALAAQVLVAAGALRGTDGAPLLRAITVSSRCPPPFDRPDLVVTTPGALVTLLRDVEGYGWLWTPEGLASAVRHLVVDEADLLLNGGYERDLKNILELMKVYERRQMEEAAAAQLRVSPELMRGLPRPLKLALWDGGVKALLAAGWRSPGAARSSGGGGGGEERAAGIGKDAAAALRKQYAFVAATMPAVSQEDTGSELQRRYKGAVWVAGDLLHRSKPRVTHEWVELQEDGQAWADALTRAVTGCEDYAAGRARVLVFSKDVASADAVSELLGRRGVRHHVYHKAVPQEDREAALLAMATAAATDGPGGSSSGSSGGGGGGRGNVVLVSTDAAARGIDLPGVTHVVQADFALNAVDFIHRIGRTARADRGGKVTSLVLPEASVLAAALRAYVEEGRPLEGAFSRNRSFSKKVRKYGTFVPRGEEGPGSRGEGGGGAEARQ